MRRPRAAALCALPLILPLLAVIFGSLAAPPAVQAAAEPAPVNVPTDKEAEQIRTIIQGLHRAISEFFTSGKIDPVMKYYTALRSYYPPFGEPQDSSKVRQRLENHAPRVTSFQSLVGPIQVSISGNLAVATCEIDEQYAFDGDPSLQHILGTYVLERHSGGWRIIHEHQSIKASQGALTQPGP